MRNGMRTCIASTIFTLLLVAPATSQEPATDPLAYTPTCDALWDTYAQALLEQLPGITFSTNSTTAWVLPSELLDSWEADFGGDPRYWQLRFWNAIQQFGYVGDETNSPIDYLLLSREIDAGDVMTEMLIYKHRQDTPRMSLDWCDIISPEEKPGFEMSGNPPDRETRIWLREQEFLLRDKLTAACPDESWAWYTSAMNRFDYGDWKAGLEEMRRGNEAINNRRPLPFPASFVLSRLANGQQCGSEVAAGIVAEGFMSWPMPDLVLLKDHAKNQEVRISMGAPLSELAPWHFFTCRFGSMEGAGVMHWLNAHVIMSQTLRKLFVETPESFTIDQRDALWGLYARVQLIKRFIREHGQNTDNGMALALEKVFIKHNISDIPDMSDFYDLWKFDTYPELGPELQVEFYRWFFQDFEAEYVTVAAKVKIRFDMLATFDFATFSWPE